MTYLSRNGVKIDFRSLIMLFTLTQLGLLCHALLLWLAFKALVAQIGKLDDRSLRRRQS
jgi:hypothetical protein